MFEKPYLQGTVFEIAKLRKPIIGPNTGVPPLWMAVLGWPLAGVYLVHLP